MTVKPRKFLRSLADFRLLTFCTCLIWSEYALAQQPQIPPIPDDAIWEPAIEYATAGAMPVNLMMDVVRPRKQS